MDKYNPRHFIFLILATGIVSLKLYPTVFLQNSGKEGWVAVILSSAIIYVFYMFAITTLKSAEGMDMVEVYQASVGKGIGTFLIILFCLNLFFTLIESASVQSDSMHQNMLVETPHWYFLLFFIIPATYVVCKDLTAMYTITIIGITLIMIAGIHLGVLTFQHKHVSYLFPIFENGLSAGFFIAILKSLGIYGYISITLPLLKTINDDKLPLKRQVIIGMIILIQMQIVSITGIFMTFPQPVATSYYYPKLIQTHLVTYFQILEFGELYVMLQTLGGLLLKYLVTFHALLQILKCFGVKDRLIPPVIVAVSALALGGSLIATHTSVRLFEALNWLTWISLFNFVLIPCVVLVIYRIKETKKQTA